MHQWGSWPHKATKVGWTPTLNEGIDLTEMVRLDLGEPVSEANDLMQKMKLEMATSIN